VSTPAPRYVCPQCRTSYVTPLRFCQQCGADMQHASALEQAARREGRPSGEHDAAVEVASEADPHESQRAARATAADRRVSASAQTWLGRLVDGRYRVIEVVGRGGMGVVYKVEHVRMGKIAAMKVLHKDLAEDPDVVRRFEREAQAISRLEHPNTVQVFDFGTVQGALYLIMEHVRGQDLAHIIERDGPLPFARAAPLLIQVCGALAEAHELGIVHRDLKPENVLITRTTGGRDFAKVLDFGLAKLGAREPSPRDTDKTEIIGTPYFMSPEQIRGDEVDARSDVYSLGALMYTALSGRPPFTARTAVGVLTKHLTAEVEPPSQAAPQQDLSSEIDAIVLRALDKDAARRWPTVAAMASAIEQVYGDQVGDRTPAATARHRRGRGLTEGDDEPLSELRLRRSDLDAFERSLRRRRGQVTASMVVIAVAGLGALAWWVWLRTPPLHAAEVEPNNDDGQATRIAAGTDVTGYLGRRLSRTEPDRDVYRIDAPSDQPRLVTVRLSAVPNIDVRFALRDAHGRTVASADEAGVGGAEALRRWRVSGPLWIEVTETMAPTQPLPTENVSDAYTLTVTADHEDTGWETEPNGNRADATPILPGTALRGWLDARGDVDLVRWDGETGLVAIEVGADPALPMIWRGPDDTPRAPGAATVTLEHGAVLRLERTDRDWPRDQALPGVDAPWVVTVTPVR
jgi:eukaryotic-like serine/threonine-protein kinase